MSPETTTPPPPATAPGEAPSWPPELVRLYNERYEPMVRLAYLLTSNRQVAEELAQDAFVAVHRLWPEIREPAAYLRQSVVNACRSWLRRRRLRDEREPAAGLLARDAHDVLRPDELWDVVGTLPERQRAAVVLRYYEDLPDKAIASILGCRVTTVRTSIHRALAKMRKEIEP